MLSHSASAVHTAWSGRDGESLRIDLAWGLWGARFEAFWTWHSMRERRYVLESWDRETHPLWPPQFGNATWETGSGAKEHAEPRPPDGVRRTHAHEAALARALGVEIEPRPGRDTPVDFLLE